MGAVGGQGVAVADLAAAGQVSLVQDDVDVGVPVEAYGEPAAVDGDDGAELAVGDTDDVSVDGAFVLAVAPQGDPGADPVSVVAVGGVGGGEQAPVGEHVDRRLVQPCDEVVGAGQHHRVQAGVDRRHPAGDGVGDHRVGIGGDDHPAVLTVGVNGVRRRCRCAARRGPAVPTRRVGAG